MSLGNRVGSVPDVDLPDGFGTTTSWERAAEEIVERSRINRGEWMVRVGDGGYHRLTFVLDDGEMRGECDCRAYRHRDWCAHLAAMVRGYVRQEVEPADLSVPVEEEVDHLWADHLDGRPKRGGLR